MFVSLQRHSLFLSQAASHAQRIHALKERSQVALAQLADTETERSNGFIDQNNREISRCDSEARLKSSEVGYWATLQPTLPEESKCQQPTRPWKPGTDPVGGGEQWTWSLGQWAFLLQLNTAQKMFSLFKNPQQERQDSCRSGSGNYNSTGASRNKEKRKC